MCKKFFLVACIGLLAFSISSSADYEFQFYSTWGGPVNCGELGGYFKTTTAITLPSINGLAATLSAYGNDITNLSNTLGIVRCIFHKDVLVPDLVGGTHNHHGNGSNKRSYKVFVDVYTDSYGDCTGVYIYTTEMLGDVQCEEPHPEE